MAHAEKLSAKYKVYWGGMHVADLAAQADNHSISTQIDSRGMVALVSNYKNRAEATLTYTNGEYVPSRFSKESEKVTGKKHTKMSYTKNGEVIDLKSSENLSQATAKEAGSLRAVDPLSAFMIAREKVRAAIRNNVKQFSFPTYDGKKLARLEFELLGMETRSIHNQDKQVLHIRMTRVPLAGFKVSENKNSIVELYVSMDEHLLPIMADAKAPLGHATIILDQSCFPADQCA